MSSNEHQAKPTEYGNHSHGNDYTDPNDTIVRPPSVVGSIGTGTVGAGTVITASHGETMEAGEGSEIHTTGGNVVNATGGAVLVGSGGTNTYNVLAGQNTLNGVNPESDDINVSSGATAVLNLTSNTANFSTGTTNNSGTLIVNAAPSTTSTIMGSRGSDDINGGTGAVTVQESAGDDVINGGTGGTNTVVYNNVTSNALIVGSTGTTATVQKASIGGTDTLNHVQRVHFADTNVALDVDGNAGLTAKILGAVFGQGSLSNAGYVGIGLSYLDSSTSTTKYADLMQLALNAAGATTSTAEVNLLYTNLLHAAPTAAQAAPYIAMLDSGATTAAALGTMAADSGVNVSNINLVGLQHTGIHYH
jgi:hypothetical protein